MATKILMPKMSDTMEEGVIATWLKKVGDTIKSGDVIAEIETDKATMEYEEITAGVMLWQAPEKSTVKVDDLLCIIGKAGEDFQDLLGGGGATASKSTTSNAAETVVVAEAKVETPVATVAVTNAKVVTMPKMSDTMEEGVVANWLKKVGDVLKPGDIIAEVETDKATMELENYEKGTLLYVAVENGGSVAIDGLLYIVGEAGANYQALIDQFKGGGATIPAKTEEKTAIATNGQAKAEEKTEIIVETANGRIKVSPLAKKLAQDKGINLSQVKGTGEGGRIVKKDIESFVPSAKPSETTAKTETKPVTVSTATFGQESFEEVPVTQMRKTIAKRLAESKFTAPHFYLTMEINMDEAMKSREQINAMIAPNKISFNDMVVKAAAIALRQHPAVNSSWLGDKIRINHHVHIGVAVAVDEGLLVPVVRFADQKTLTQISAETKDLAGKAKNKKLQPADWAGNTFSISNLGMFGIDEFTAIINPPDSCILAVGAIKQTGVVKDGQLVIGNIMKVTLSCDHRVVDGASGAAFLKTLKDLLEAPVRMLV
ncbi:MAG: pyruvate dehydrogenase complex dihydrolipoamide acetyltransferase [Microscillaceae bacterium]|jgi:pyruvate dehydrogenase E2 component (dihydrolipoamide acetyltransferase)|nr:pyruvate dehydrogenase complex dihydrolipoamide acetyltransferase [Microscillaceae bacterium]